jgi:hypothetical protein
MTLDQAIAAAGRTEAARDLIAKAQTGLVDLVTLSALQLCVLDGPSHAMFDQRVAHAWTRVEERRRRQLTEEVTAGMVRRGLLIGDHPGHGAQQPDSTYTLMPELGLVLAARCRPSFTVVAAGEGEGLRPLSVFALGDLAEPVRGLVAEVPAGLPPDRAARYPKAAKLGPLGWIYRYVLVSPPTAAEILSRWTIAQPPRQRGAVPARYLVSAYRPDREHPASYTLGVTGDGSRAFVDGSGAGVGDLTRAGYDLEGLTAIMLNLLAEASR